MTRFRRNRRSLLCLAAALATLASGGCGGSAHHSDPGARVVYRNVPRHPAVHHHPQVARLQRQLSRWLRAAGPATGASVFDLSDGTALYALHPDVKRPPASVEKLYTSVALLRQLGSDARLHTLVLGTGHLTAEGTWTGNLYLRGDGDPTLSDGAFRQVWFHGAGASVEDLARQLQQAGIRRVAGQVIGDASLFDSHRGGPATALGPDLPDFGGQLSALVVDHGASQGGLSPGAFAARQLAQAMNRMGIRATAAPATARAPHRAHRLAVAVSPAVAALLSLMNIPSDDLFAEMLTKRLGVDCCGQGSIAAGAQAIAAEIRQLGLHPHIVDGSGLSRQDQSSPAEIVALLRDVWRTPTGDALMASLPTLGRNGTVRNIGVRTAAQGRCVGKTGTLNGVTNLAGTCRSRQHHTLAFALFLDGPSNQTALALLSHMAAAIAQYP